MPWPPLCPVPPPHSQATPRPTPSPTIRCWGRCWCKTARGRPRPNTPPPPPTPSLHQPSLQALHHIPRQDPPTTLPFFRHLSLQSRPRSDHPPPLLHQHLRLSQQAHHLLTATEILSPSRSARHQA